MSGKANKLTVGDVRYALKLCNGLITEAAAFLNCSAPTLARYIDQNQDLKVVINEARASIVDLAERRLIEKLQAGSEPSILFTLRTIGKDRGYGDKAELTTPTGGIKLTLPDDFPMK